MQKPHFREDKATQVAAFILKRNGGRMAYLKLIKLMYLAERKALLTWGRSITYDSFVSLDHGPVLSETLNLINGYFITDGAWKNSISSPGNYEVELIDDPGLEKLSDREELLLDEILSRFGRMDRWVLRDITHKLPEWKDPQGSAIPIEYEDILKLAEDDESDIQMILEEINETALMEQYLG